MTDGSQKLKEIPRYLEHPIPRVPILQWWEGHYDKVFVILNPFFKVPANEGGSNFETIDVRGTSYLVNDYRLHDHTYVDINDYIKRHGQIISWSIVHQELCPDLPFSEFARNVWLLSVGGNPPNRSPKISKLISNYTDMNALFLPDDGIAGAIQEPIIADFLDDLMIKTLTLFDELREISLVIKTKDFRRGKASVYIPDAIISSERYCIHDEQSGLLMTWGYDESYGFIGLPSELALNAKPEDYFEGFYVDDCTYADWLNPLDFFEREKPRDTNN